MFMEVGITDTIKQCANAIPIHIVIISKLYGIHGQMFCNFMCIKRLTTQCQASQCQALVIT